MLANNWNTDRLAEAAARIESKTGLSYPENRRCDLQRGLRSIAAEIGLKGEADCIAWLLDSPWSAAKTDLCASHLTIPETYFFREPRAFRLICEYALEKFRNAAPVPASLRIWSAACCTGEEPYTVAMSLKDNVPDLDAHQVSILGTDLNARYLEIARAGIYRNWSFRTNNKEIRKYFSETEKGEYLLDPAIRHMVNFAVLNLADKNYPSVTNGTSELDIVLCRNVLMYMSKEQAAEIISRIRRCLNVGGWLIVSASEASAELFAGFSAVCFPEAIFYRKTAETGHTGIGPARVMTEDAGMAEVGNSLHQADCHPKFKPVNLARKPAGKAPARVRELHVQAGEAELVEAARRLANQGKTAEAVRSLRQGMRSMPASARLLHALAQIEMEAGDNEAAICSLKQVLYLQPDFIIAHYLLGILLLEQQRPLEARRQFQAAGKLLAALAEDAIVPGSDGLSAAYLIASISAFTQKEMLWQ